MWGWDGGVKFTDIVADGIDTFQVRWSWGDMVDGYSDSTFYANPPLPTNITRIFSYGKLIYEAKYRYGEKVE